MKKFIAFFIIFIFSGQVVTASQVQPYTTDELQQIQNSMNPTTKAQLEEIEMQLQIDEIDEAMQNTDSIYKDYTFKELFTDSVTGQLDLSFSNMINSFFKILFKEIYANNKIMKQVLVIVLLSALLKNLTESFKNKGVGELAFYVTYIALVMYLLASFYIVVDIVNGVIYSLSSLIIACMPLMMGLLVITGSVASSYIFSPIMFFTAEGITIFITNVLSPIIILSAGLEVINYITEKKTLKNFANLLKEGCEYALKLITVCFLGILTIQRISAPILNNLALKTTKATMGAIPVVGGVLNGAIDSVMYFSDAVKSGALVTIILIIISICIVPIIKILAIVITYKLMAAVIQPISDPRIVKCIDSIGSYTAMLLGCVVLVMVMFIFSVMIILSIN